MEKKRLLLLISLVAIIFLVLALSIKEISAAEISSCPTQSCPADNDYCIFYFYGIGCPHCAEVSPLIDSLSEKYSNFTLHKLEIYFNQTNKQLFDDFTARYGIKQKGVPAIFISSDALLGTEQIKDNLEGKIQYYLKNKPVCPMNYNKQEPTAHQLSPSEKKDVTILAVILAAAADSINPCAFAVLIFLLLYLTTIASRRKMLKVGLVYILTVFIVYFLSGLGLFTFIQYAGITKFVFYLSSIIAIFAGLINIKDFFFYGKGITLAIPESKKGTIEKYIHFASMPAAIILGILVSMFELPCTGGVYLAILSLLANSLTRLQALPWLLLYNLIFILPLVIILIAVTFGFSPEKADKFRLEKRKYLRLIMGLVMLILGLAMLLGWFG